MSTHSVFELLVQSTTVEGEYRLVAEWTPHGGLPIRRERSFHPGSLAGLALLPRWLVAEHLRAGTLVDVFPHHDATGTVHDAAIWLAYPSREYVPVKVRAFLDFVRARFTNGPPWEQMLR